MAHGVSEYVSTTGRSGRADDSCATAAYNSIQAAVTAATAGQTVELCAGTYTTQVTIGKDLTLTGLGAKSVIDPRSTSPATVKDLDTGQTTVAIIDVTSNATVTVKDLAVDGNGLQSNFAWPGCADDFVGVFYQDASGSATTVTVRTVALSPGLRGCQDGVGVFVQSGTSGHAKVAVKHDSVTAFDKAGIVCNDTATTCVVSNATTVTGNGPTSATAQNDVQIAFGATGSVTGDTLSDADYSSAGGGVEPQATFAAGVLLFGAKGTTKVENDTLSNDQAAVELSDSSGTVHTNQFVNTPGIAGAVGVFAVPCTIYCSTLGLTAGTDDVTVTGNKITFKSPVTGTTAIWLGDGAASSTGSVDVTVSSNTVKGALQDVVLGPTAYGSVTVGKGGDSTSNVAVPTSAADHSPNHHSPTH